jgi:peptidoglycan/LPS O-acetylase OafA/YrhL
MSTPHASRSRELDAVRGIAAMLVILFHYTVRYGEIFGDSAAPFQVRHGFFGVELFFGVSGFVILMTLMKMASAGDFVIARFARLFPTYWVAVVVTFIVMALFPLPGRTVGWPQAVFNLTMLQEFFSVPHVDSVYWSLEVELVFYAWMLVVLAAGWLPRARALIATWLLVAIAAYLASMALGRALPVIVNRVLLLEYSAYFAIGATAFLDFSDGRMSRTSWWLYAFAVAVAWLAHGPRGLGVALGMVVLFSLIAQRRAGLLNMRVLVFLGTISYPLYLLHQNIGYAIIHGLRAHSIGYGWAMLAAMAVSLAGATALSFGVERPARRWFRSWGQRRRAITPAAGDVST